MASDKRRRTRQRPHHHHEVVDQAVVVEVQEIAAVDLLARHGRFEDQRMVAAVGVSDLTDVAEVLEDAQHTTQDRRGDRLADVGLERHRAGEHHVVGQHRLDGRLVAFLDCLSEGMLRSHGKTSHSQFVE